MQPVTPTDIKSWSKVDFDALEYGEDPQMQVLIDRATEGVMNITGRTLESMPDTHDATAQYAIQLWTEMLAYRAQPDYTETLADFDLIGSFSAGPYSETRRGVGDAAEARILTGNPALNEALRNLMTPEKLDEYLLLLSGQETPYIAFAEIDPSLPAIEPAQRSSDYWIP